MRLLTFFFTACFSQSVFSHGEDKLGPHGGYIQMPGAFHTELKKVGAQELLVYLLDIEWKNPTVKDSSIQVRFQSKSSKKPFQSTIQCEKKADHFNCRFPANVDLGKKGKLTVEAVRNNQKGNAANYDLPLTLPAAKNDHQMHH